VIIRHNVNQGFAANFLLGLAHVGPSYRYYSFSDQDDIWLPHKLEHAIMILNKQARHSGGPMLYCGRTMVTNQLGQTSTRMSPHFRKKPSFANALVQSIAGGNTMVFNNAARDVVLSTSPHQIISHDWWSYLAVSGVGGQVIYDPVPLVKYRQHGQNIIGSNNNMTARVKRLGKLFAGHFRKQISQNMEALAPLHGRLSAENQKLLSAFLEVRNAPLFMRLIKAPALRVYRQTFLDQIGLRLGLIIGKF